MNSDTFNSSSVQPRQLITWGFGGRVRQCPIRQGDYDVRLLNDT